MLKGAGFDAQESAVGLTSGDSRSGGWALGCVLVAVGSASWLRREALSWMEASRAPVSRLVLCSAKLAG